MKKMTCRDLGGVCEHELLGETFDEVSNQGYNHILNSTDDGHKLLLQNIQGSTEEEKNSWREEKQKLFDELPEV